MTNDRLIKVVSGDNLKRLDEKGQGVAVISTLGVVDKDGDVVEPGAFGKDQVVPMVPAHNWQHVPIGKGRIVEDGDEALFNFQLNMKLGHGRAYYEHLKFDMETPPAKQQWSYGFGILDSGFGEREGQRVRLLKSLRVFEVSPVLVGAGVNTRTLALKGQLWVPLAIVEQCCPACAKEMQAKGWKRISLAALIKQGFTCPKPFASFDECVNRFIGEPDIDDPEAFCAAWEEFCGERAAEAEGEKALALSRKFMQDYWARRERAIRGMKMP